MKIVFLLNLGNFIADIMRMAMQTDIAILNGGSLRSDRIHTAGNFKMKVRQWCYDECVALVRRRYTQNLYKEGYRVKYSRMTFISFSPYTV